MLYAAHDAPCRKCDGVPVSRFLQTLASFGTARLIAMGAVIAGLIAFFLFVSSRVSDSDLRLLYGDLELAESGRIVEQLTSMNVPYRVADGGRTILAPADRVNELRVTLAGEGLGGNIVGYELFDRSNGLGTTSFVQNINRLRATEGELARTIREINAVDSARVHIVLPERELFEREEREPSASIVINTRGGVGQAQVSAIRFLVSAAVPGLPAQNISIVDQNGTLLARSGRGASDEAMMLSSLSQKRQQLEDYYRGHVEQLLSRTLGPNRVRAQVAVELDESAMTTSEESYDPDTQVARSTRTIEETSLDTEGTPQNVSVANNLPDAQEDDGNGEGPRSQSERIEETINYEISRVTRQIVEQPGSIERLSVAVLVDGQYSTDANGERVYEERSEAELEQIAALVRSAVGYDANRGDVVEVANMRFAEPETPEMEAAETFRFFGLTKDDLYKLVELVLFGIVSLLVLLLVVRPLVNRLIAAIPEAAPAGAGQARLEGGDAPPALEGPDAYRMPGQIEGPASEGAGTALAASGGGQGEALSVDQVDNRLRESSVKKVGDIVRSHPEESAAIIRSWMYAE